MKADSGDSAGGGGTVKVENSPSDPTPVVAPVLRGGTIPPKFRPFVRVIAFPLLRAVNFCQRKRMAWFRLRNDLRRGYWCSPLNGILHRFRAEPPTPLERAFWRSVVRGEEHNIVVFLNRSVDSSKPLPGGLSPLLYSVLKQRLPIVSLLLEFGASPDYRV